MKQSKIFKLAIIVVFMLTVNTIFAQGTPADPDPLEDDENADLNPAPISDYLLPMLIIGVATAFILLRTKTRQEAS